MIDIHSHFLPGIDDGAPTMLDGIDILKCLFRQGVTDVIATPHFVNESSYMSPRSDNLKLLDKMKELVANEGININLYLGNEIYIDSKILELLDKGMISSLADSEYLLVEFPLDDEFPNYDDYLAELTNSGYKVILAHPERYTITQEDYDIITSLHEIGVLFQCNLRSLIGKYGKSAQKLVRRLMKDKLVFTFGSDIHRVMSNDDLLLAKSKLNKYYDKSEIKKLLVSNPEKILRGIY